MSHLLPNLIFWVFSSVLVLSCLMVISARNPVHSVLFLILAFFNAAGLFLMMGAEFVAMILVIVYVGAVAVLFLFVVMMLDIDFSHLRAGLRRQLPLALVLGGALMAEIVLAVSGWSAAPAAISNIAAPATAAAWAPQSNTHILGRLLYTQYVWVFQLAGLVLLVAMIGAIVLTLRHRPETRRQNPGLQADRRRDDVLTIRSVKTGEGIP
ncbi:MAG: NADH-quinone oxidoreductase subunit J [Pseudomonadota bacterium]|nr:NADH-quinone oxidoreductase subunit J [Pseudomonadota bacterium]